MSVYLASKNPLELWCEEIRAFVSLKEVSKEGRDGGREFVVRQSPVKTETGWKRNLYLGEQKLTFKLDPCWFLTAFPFGPWQSPKLYVISKDYFCPPFVIASEKLKIPLEVSHFHIWELWFLGTTLCTFLTAEIDSIASHFRTSSIWGLEFFQRVRPHAHDLLPFAEGGNPKMLYWCELFGLF